MKTKQKGFTLIELVVVIVLLGIIGAVATARFEDLAGDAAGAVEQGVAAELASGSTINFANRSLNPANGTAISGAAVACATVAPALLQSGLPTGITVTDGSDVDCTDGDNVVTCTVTHTNGSGATATLLCIN